MTAEEELIRRYFDAFNRHDLESVVACFHDQAVLLSSSGKRLVGLAEVRRSYETEFASFPDAHCQLRVCVGNSGHGVAEVFLFGDARRTRKDRGHRCGSHRDRGWQDKGDPRLSSTSPGKFRSGSTHIGPCNRANIVTSLIDR